MSTANQIFMSKIIPAEGYRLKDLFSRSKPGLFIFAGDSVTQGAFHTHGMRCYSEIFAERVKREMKRTSDLVINSGIDGTHTSFLLDTYQWSIGQFKPDLVSIMFGINDCKENEITPVVFKNNLETIVHKIRNTNAIPLLQTPNAIDNEGVANMNTASRKRLPAYVDVIREVAKINNIVLVDNWLYWEARGLNVYKNWLDDPLHPNAKGHLEIAQLIFSVLAIDDEGLLNCSGHC